MTETANLKWTRKKTTKPVYGVHRKQLLMVFSCAGAVDCFLEIWNVALAVFFAEFSRSKSVLINFYQICVVKVNGSFSSWQESIKSVPQGSVLGPLLFNLFINDLFFLVEETEICNYADDTTIYVCGHKLEHIVSSLKTDAQRLSK